ncbi:MAG: aspartate/tyrosine/aromatic aminotransferase [Planctomycetota bacterium]|nr:aspartate/tyrosine/aromatic aminotransferase [Planctomycetota bacterium]MDA1178487.1 aspartate/tyrosine/aromatic aminotransferase [Planctomycetota bacterium]
MLEKISVAPPDPILGLTDAFRKDTRPEKINLGVGIYQDETGRTPVLASVKRAEHLAWQEEPTKEYLGIGGDPLFTERIRDLVFGETLPANRSVTMQAPGGTGALRIAADFLHQQFPQATAWLSQPTWANHPAIFAAAGVPSRDYGYLTADSRAVDLNKMMDNLREAREGDVVLLHGCCHNPSGVDLTGDQWHTLADFFRKHRLLPLIDLAYQGFGDGLEPDAIGARHFAQQGLEFFTAASCSKNFGIYRERVGALTIATESASSIEAVTSQVKVAVRCNFSNPPAHGAAVVARVLGDSLLRQLWTQELDTMRGRIRDMRDLFAAEMQLAIGTNRFDFIRQQRGMFSFAGLTPAQVDRLRDEHAIYMVRSGRMNVAGMCAATLPRLAQAIASVL